MLCVLLCSFLRLSLCLWLLSAGNIIRVLVSGSHGDPCSDLRPLRCMDAAGQGEDHRGEPEGADQERHQLRASVPGKLKNFVKHECQNW